MHFNNLLGFLGRSKERIFAALRDQEKQLRVLDKLSGFAIAANRIEEWQQKKDEATRLLADIPEITGAELAHVAIRPAN